MATLMTINVPSDGAGVHSDPIIPADINITMDTTQHGITPKHSNAGK